MLIAYFQHVKIVCYRVKFEFIGFVSLNSFTECVIDSCTTKPVPSRWAFSHSPLKIVVWDILVVPALSIWFLEELHISFYIFLIPRSNPRPHLVCVRFAHSLYHTAVPFANFQSFYHPRLVVCVLNKKLFTRQDC